MCASKPWTVQDDAGAPAGIADNVQLTMPPLSAVAAVIAEADAGLI